MSLKDEVIKAFDEAKHPRVSAGLPDGGEFKAAQHKIDADGRGIPDGKHKGVDFYNNIVDLNVLRRKLKREGRGVDRIFLAYLKNPWHHTYYNKVWVTETRLTQNGDVKLIPWRQGYGKSIKEWFIYRPEDLDEIPGTSQSPQVPKVAP